MDLKKQLETTETTIKALQEYAESLRSMMEKEAPKKWSPVGGNFFISGDGGVVGCSTGDINYRNFGHERSSQEQAKKAAMEMRKFNRLLALRDELCGGDEVDWSDASSFKYTLEFIVDENRWSVDSTRIYQKIAVYFTTKKDVDQACDMLNSGEVEL
jgi:hypothetical protein